MDLFEYQGKELLRKFEVPVPEGRVAETPDQAAEAAKGLGGRVVVKAQVLPLFRLTRIVICVREVVLAGFENRITGFFPGYV